ncbi:MAG: HD domain-containing phosphohydrolase [Fimbriimonas sp.]
MRRGRVLIVDDEPAIGRSMKEGLAMQGFTTHYVDNARDALKLLREEDFDGLISDFHMPHMCGDELIKKALKVNSHLATVMVTSASDVPIAVKLLKEGAFDYILKPFDMQDVAIRMERALDRRRLMLENQEYQRTLERRVQEQAESILQMLQNSLQALTHALEAKDRYTRNHSDRVSALSYKLAEVLVPDDPGFVEKVRTAALFHDIGKIGVSEAALLSPDPLSDEMYEDIKKHPVIGETILTPLFNDREFLDIVRHHHERWDGGGYPDALQGTGIPIGARIVAVCDALDAMISERPYRAAKPVSVALEILRDGAGKQWDPVAVSALCELVESGELISIVGLIPMRV